MIDTHCHLYLPEIMTEIDQVMVRADAAGVKKFYLPAIDSTSTAAMKKLEDKYPGSVFSMAGLHPCSVKENFREEIDHIKTLLHERKFWGIGETGIDLYWDKSFLAQQIEALDIQAELALAYNLPLILHTRNATQETIDVIKKYRGTGLSGIFHCFGGTLHEAEQIIEAGFYLGIGGVVTYKNSGLAEVLQHIDMKHIVPETDAPYLSPVPFRGKRNESAYLKYIIEKIAAVKNISVEEADRISTENAEKIFGA